MYYLITEDFYSMGITGVKVTDKEVIKNGTTTIVNNETEIRFDDKFWDEFYKFVDFMTDEGMAVDVAFKNKGVSKLHPDDTYDELKGKVIASKKAEVKGLKDAYDFLGIARDYLIEMLADIAVKRHSLDKRRTSLKESFKND